MNISLNVSTLIACWSLLFAWFKNQLNRSSLIEMVGDAAVLKLLSGLSFIFIFRSSKRIKDSHKISTCSRVISKSRGDPNVLYMNDKNCNLACTFSLI